jgi:hypothetical protein
MMSREIELDPIELDQRADRTREKLSVPLTLIGIGPTTVLTSAIACPAIAVPAPIPEIARRTETVPWICGMDGMCVISRIAIATARLATGLLAIA